MKTITETVNRSDYIKTHDKILNAGGWNMRMTCSLRDAPLQIGNFHSMRSENVADGVVEFTYRIK